MNKKKISIIIISILVVILVICLVKIFINNDSPKQIESEQKQNQIETNRVVTTDGITKLNIAKRVDGLEFSNVEIQMISEHECELRAMVLNLTEEIVESKTIKITTKDGENQKQVFGAQMTSVLPNETIQVNAVIRKDITSAIDVAFEIVD